ncbi:MAG TPA: hypothetical protein VKQ36_04920, partial [Ktedonobacterales bacterium]|nr:hypothetical protein [Ktedonobacterales bacterium]
EVVDTSSLEVNPDSGQARAASTAPTPTPTVPSSPTPTTPASPHTATTPTSEARAPHPQGAHSGSQGITLVPILLIASGVVVVGLLIIWLYVRRLRLPRLE